MSETVKAEKKQKKEETAVAKTEQAKPPMMFGTRGLELQSLDDAWRFANYVKASGLAPKSLQTPEAIVVALELGKEVGLAPMQSLQSIAVINGTPSIYGDAALALVRGSGLLEAYEESYEGEGDDYACLITTKRKGMAPMRTSFSVRDAKAAGLWGKQGPWKQYPKRMLMFRSRGFNLRDNFGDVLKGLKSYEEVRDITVDVEVGPAMSAGPTLDQGTATPPRSARVPEPVEAEDVPEDVQEPSEAAKAPKATKTAKKAPKAAETPSEPTTTVSEPASDADEDAGATDEPEDEPKKTNLFDPSGREQE